VTASSPVRSFVRTVMPLGGDVSQWFDILRNFGNFAGARIGLFNIDLGLSRNPAVEQAVLDEVGSYGRQIGRLTEALVVVLDAFEPKRPLTPAEAAAIDDLRLMAAHVEAIKRREADGAA